jgi:hypothetical protein
VLPRIAALLTALLVAAACSSEGTSNDCKEVCRSEAACVDQVGDDGKEDEEQNRFDQSECIAACDALSRDEVGKKLVEKHTECARKNKDDCAALLQCK